MESFFKLQFWQILIVLILTSGVLITIVILFIKAGFKIKAGKLEMNTKGFEGSERRKLPPSLIAARVAEIVTKKCYIDLRATLSEQMLYAEQKILTIKHIYNKNFFTVLKEHGVTDMTKNKDYVYYDALIKLLVYDIKEMFREALINNHLLEYSSDDFELYQKEKAEQIILTVNDFLNTFYVGDGRDVTPEEIYKRNKNSVKDITSIIRNILQKASVISEAKVLERRKLDSELKGYTG